MSERVNNDVDPIETRDWLQAIESVIREEGVERAQFLLDQVLNEARKGGVSVAVIMSTPSLLKTNLSIRVTWSWNATFVLLSAGTRS